MAAAAPEINAVTISPDPAVGQTVTATVSVRAHPTLGYEWLSCTGETADTCTAIPQAIGATYAVDPVDAGLRLSVRVTATNRKGETDVEQSPLTAGVKAPPRLTSVTVAGQAVIDQTLAATAIATGFPAPTVSYQWLRCGVGCLPIGGATDAAYTVRAADAGYRLVVEATAQNELAGDTGRSEPTAVVLDPPRITAVTIAGNPVVGATLAVAATATGGPTPTVTFQWLRCAADAADTCVTIPGATAWSYQVAAADVGRRLAVMATAVNPLGAAMSRSQPTAPVPEPRRSSRFDQAGASPVPVLGPMPTLPSVALLYLRPFPTVRIKGRLVDGGARITLLRVRAPRGSTVVVRCRRSGCPLRRRSVRVGRIRRLERFLRAGIRITIRVSKPGLIGKFVRVVIRDGTVPKRRDACLMPGDAAPVDCPPA
jgi:hypothetical protein